MSQVRDSSISGVGIPADESRKQAFQELARGEAPGLFALARRLGEGEPEDVVQECLLRAYRSFASLRDVGAGGAWLRTILLNIVRDRARRQAHTPSEVTFDEVEEFSLYRRITDEDPFPYSDSLHLDFLACFDQEDVRSVLARLPVLYRAPLVLRYIEDFDTREIANMLEAPLGTVLSRLHRGRKLFERELWSYAASGGLLREPVAGGGNQ
jgi:RNA polymerase sigma-70 factor (ECF subfamily)